MMTVRDHVIELRKIRHADKLVERIIHGAADEIVRLREEMGMLLAQRDEARREVCKLAARAGNAYEEHVARERGWDCFKE